MPGPKPTPCTFSDDFLQVARRATRKRTALVQEVQRYRLALAIHEHPDLSNGEIGRRVGMSERQVRRWRQRWALGDWSVIDREGRGRKADFSPAGSRLGRCGRL
jgi:Homeodomain-like domain